MQWLFEGMRKEKKRKDKTSDSQQHTDRSACVRQMNEKLASEKNLCKHTQRLIR